jgi:hypothetical protein
VENYYGYESIDESRKRDFRRDSFSYNHNKRERDMQKEMLYRKYRGPVPGQVRCPDTG